MKNKSIIFIVLYTVGIALPSYAHSFIKNHAFKNTLTGKITNKSTGESLPGVSIYFPDLKTGDVSNVDGTYKIENLPSSKVLIQVSFIGYKLITETIDLNTTVHKDFALEESVAELHEVVVTGTSRAGEKNRTATPIATIAHLQLLQNSSSNIIDALATQPGISQVTTGSGISKPVIRGLGYNRVVTVKDGIRQEGQQWGDEHGIEADEYTINKVEILKGPASLSYGSDAIAGVINMLSAPTMPDGNIQGNILTNYQSNNGLFAYSANLAGNKKGFIWDIRYSDKNAHAYKNKYDGYVLNSGYHENTFGGILGFNKSWGYSHLHFSKYDLTPGIIEGERENSSGKFLKPIAINDTTEGVTIGTERDLKSYTPLTPYQKIHHLKAVLNNSIILGNGSLKATLGIQQNRRQEYADILNENQYGLYFLLNTINYDLRYLFPEKNHFDISIGINGMHQISQNKGFEYLIPEYNLFDAGIFFIAKKTIKQLDISGGVRIDTRKENGKDLFLNEQGEKTTSSDVNAMHQFNGFKTTFSGMSGSIGATYQFSEHIFTKLNAARGFRAPNIAELSANGIHEGTLNYIIGVPSLLPEHSLQLDYSLGLNTRHVTAEIDLFSNSINNFIFLSKLANKVGSDSLTNGYRTFKYSSGNADLLGGEISIDIHPHPLDWLHFENSFSYLVSKQRHQPDSTKYLPFTPPAKFNSELKATAKKMSKGIGNAYFKIGLEHYFAQNKYYSAFNTETATAAYTLVNAGIGADFMRKGKTTASLYLSANNITDVAYQSHLSRLKYTDMNDATGRIGVFNMGRNISFKLMVPLYFTKT